MKNLKIVVTYVQPKVQRKQQTRQEQHEIQYTRFLSKYIERCFNKQQYKLLLKTINSIPNVLIAFEKLTHKLTIDTEDYTEVLCTDGELNVSLRVQKDKHKVMIKAAFIGMPTKKIIDRQY